MKKEIKTCKKSSLFLVGIPGKKWSRHDTDRFGLTKSCLATHLHEFCAMVNDQVGHYISWPVVEALQSSELGFARAGFPHTVCAVDGCHISILKPNVETP